MKKLISGLGLMLAVGFSGAATAGVCTKAKIAGAYGMEATYKDVIDVREVHGVTRIWLNSNGKGKASAWLDAQNGFLEGGYVDWPIEWDVGEDCVGIMRIDGGFELEAAFVVTGNKKAPVLMGGITNGFESGRMRAEKIKF